jgi:predicted nucleic acid-binding protein
LTTLLDSSVLVAALAKTHPNSAVISCALADIGAAVVFDHSFLEAYRVLTGQNVERGGFNKPPGETVLGLQRLTRAYRVIGLSPRERIDALSHFAGQNVISARIYDALIGYAGILHGAQRIMTLNGKNFRSLFPALEIIEPV